MRTVSRQVIIRFRKLASHNLPVGEAKVGGAAALTSQWLRFQYLPFTPILKLSCLSLSARAPLFSLSSPKCSANFLFASADFLPRFPPHRKELIVQLECWERTPPLNNNNNNKYK